MVLMDRRAIFHRLEVAAERNNAHVYPAGAYYPIENLLLRLAMVTEVLPRLSLEVLVEAEKAPALKTGGGAADGASTPSPGGQKKKHWASGACVSPARVTFGMVHTGPPCVLVWVCVWVYVSETVW